MLRLIIIAALVYGAYYVATSLTGKYKSIEQQNGAQTESAPSKKSGGGAPVSSQNLDGMPPQLQGSLDLAQSQGPGAMKRWLDANRRYCRDPKLGDIELDYAVALMRQNSVAARELYQNVKNRTPANSPLQARLQRLSKTFE
jgi:hypothetical protein